MRYKYDVDMYDWDSYKSSDAWMQLLVTIATMTVIAFPLNIGMIAATGIFPVTMRLIPLYVVVSVGEAAVATILVLAANHPNPWIRRAGLGIMFLTPPVIVLLFG